MLPLGLLSPGEEAHVVGQRHPRSLREAALIGLTRLEEMGIRLGKAVEVLNNEGSGPLLVRVDESRIAIDRGTAMKILVRRKT
ncbi:MAG: ferrous iron transport protein A [Armatimonadetes bacterium]|nr:ferrous iron transport protein A [Armatimonadota bacterium]